MLLVAAHTAAFVLIFYNLTLASTSKFKKDSNGGVM